MAGAVGVFAWAVVQAIVTRDQGYEQARRTMDFVKRYVFPGGQLPSLGALLGAAARVSDLRLVHLEEISPHYAETLRRWRMRFLANGARIRSLGYPERVLRLFEFYLRYCEAAFEERSIGVVQLVFERAACRARPILGVAPPLSDPDHASVFAVELDQEGVEASLALLAEKMAARVPGDEHVVVFVHLLDRALEVSARDVTPVARVQLGLLLRVVAVLQRG